MLFSASEEARRAERIFKAPRSALPSWSDSPSSAAIISSHSLTLARVMVINSSSSSGDGSSSRAEKKLGKIREEYSSDWKVEYENHICEE